MVSDPVSPGGTVKGKGSPTTENTAAGSWADVKVTGLSALVLRKLASRSRLSPWGTSSKSRAGVTRLHVTRSPVARKRYVTSVDSLSEAKRTARSPTTVPGPLGRKITPSVREPPPGIVVGMSSGSRENGPSAPTCVTVALPPSGLVKLRGILVGTVEARVPRLTIGAAVRGASSAVPQPGTVPARPIRSSASSA